VSLVSLYMSTPVVTQADLEKTAEELGKKLGFYLASAPWPDEVKAAWAHLLEDMTIEEISEFSELMEFMYADAMTQEIDGEFKKQAEALRAGEQDKKKELDALYSRIRQRIAQ
jgi:hypothetical protein